MITYKTQGVCSSAITFSIDNDLVRNVSFSGGCPGNLKGIGNLVEGLPVQEVIERLKGIRCGRRITSCPDQLSKALEQYLTSYMKKSS